MAVIGFCMVGIVFYKYYASGVEVYKKGELIRFDSKTDQNGKIMIFTTLHF